MQHNSTRTTHVDHLFASDHLRLCVLETMTALNLLVVILLLLTAPVGGAA